METIWNLKPIDKQVALDLSCELDIPQPVAAVMANRGLTTPEEIELFCEMGMKRLHSPFTLPDIKPVLARLHKALDDNEKIFCWGDYDVDGVTATSVVVTVLRKLGADLAYHVPHRMIDGYDIKKHSVDKAIESGASLLISVDCGILAFETADYAKEKGIDLIITDHHHPSADGKIPDCVGVVNPNRDDPNYPGAKFANHAAEGFTRYPFDALAGVGIAFKVMIALAQQRGLNVREVMADTLEYVALGTVADIAPMVDENRSLVWMGCQLLTNSKKVGIQELLKVAEVKNVTTTTIGFAIGPRINAIGRLGDSGIALDLLLENNDRRAKYLANILDTTNKQRQVQQESMTKEALATVEEKLAKEEKKIIVIWAKGWHKGLVGLVAGKVAESFGRPCLCITVSDDGETARGSCRSSGDFNILNALKSPGCGELFTKCGGHAFAAGFDLPAANLELLDKRLNEYASGYIPGRYIDIDARIMAGDINAKTYNSLSKMAPFGNGNPQPVFIVKNITIAEIEPLSGGKHLKMILKGGRDTDKEIRAVAWRVGHLLPEFPVGSKIDAVFKLNMDEFRGKSQLTMQIEDFRHVET